MPIFVAVECDLMCNQTTEDYHYVAMAHPWRKNAIDQADHVAIQTIITSSRGHDEHAAFCFEAVPQLYYMEQVMTQTGSQW